MTGLPLNIDWQQILLHLFNFVILAGGLYILLYKPVKDFMEKRIQYYREMDAASGQVHDKAFQTKEEYEKKLKDAEAEIAQMRTKAADEARQAGERQLAKARQEADKIISDARKKAEAENRRMVQEAGEEIARLAGEAAAKLLSGEDDMYGEFARTMMPEGDVSHE